jgi:mannosyltransferase OCH1-like enzyme
MIPKTIHYCWVGPRPKSQGILSSIKSWERLNPDFSIKLWDESNFAIDAFPFTKKMYAEKRWAFVADYIRLHVLEEYGGVYLDADMYLVQPLAPLLDAPCILGEESRGIISAGMVGAVAHHPYILACKKFYDEHGDELMTIPRVLTKIYNEH